MARGRHFGARLSLEEGRDFSGGNSLKFISKLIN